MSYSDMPIRPLPPEVAAKVRSSVRITHLNDVVLELVKNALDADAVSINITVDFRRGGLVVEDDGYGIPSAEFGNGSGLGQAHNTSKAGRQSVFGSKGLFLAALATMSLLTITSRHHGQTQTNTLIFHHSEVISRLIPAPSHQAIKGTQGTRITVNNLFGNMPVRLKHRASTLQRPEDVDKEWEELKRMLVALVLPNERLQKLRVSDNDKTRTMNLRIPSISVEKPDFDFTRLQMILTQSGLIPYGKMRPWVSMSANTPDLSIEAYVSLCPSPTKLVQFISIGINPIFSTHNSANVLYNEVNQIFATSDFGSSDASNQHKSATGESSSKGASRGGMKWPMFYIRIGSSASWKMPETDERTVESDRTLQHVINVLDAMFYQFLQQHHFRPRKAKRMQQFGESTAIGSTNTLDKNAKHLAQQQSYNLRNFSSWTRVKSGDAKAFGDLFENHHRNINSIPVRSLAPKTDLPNLQPSSFPHTSSRGTLQTGDPPRNDSNLSLLDEGKFADEVISWTEPGTNDVILVNSRTGQCLSRNGTFKKSIRDIRPRSTGGLMYKHTRNDIQRPQSAPAGDRSVWLESLMSGWDNPVFSRAERPIMSTVPRSHDETQVAGLLRDIRRLESVSTQETSLNRGSGKLSKEGLAKACVIGQVDGKFILVRMPHNQTLVLVDQHAADERCRVEQLFSDMFAIEDSRDGSSRRTSIRIHEFPTPLQFGLEEQETQLFTSYSRFFGSWGCHYKVNTSPDRRKSLIVVSALPIGIAERCRLEPSLLVDLLRKEMWNGAGDRVPPNRSSSYNIIPERSTSHQWLNLISGCPEGIIDLLNSRACRTSIMFNDSLSRKECQNLISRLSRCAFPFQCAHGRPSMIPIVDESFPSGNFPDYDSDFLDTFKRWAA